MSEHLLDQIQVSKPVAPEALRKRVRALGATQPTRVPLFSRLLQRRFLVAVPATLVVGLLAVGAAGGEEDGRGFSGSHGVRANYSVRKAMQAK